MDKKPRTYPKEKRKRPENLGPHGLVKIHSDGVNPKTGEATTRRGRMMQVKNPVNRQQLNTRFTLRFWDEVDQRKTEVRWIIARYKALLEDANITTIQGDALVQRIAFIQSRIESMEVGAVEGEQFNTELYLRLVNALKGLVQAIGIEPPKSVTVDALASIIERAKK